MKLQLITVLLAVGVAGGSSLVAQDAGTREQYVCVADMSAGFNHDDTSDEWDKASFIADERRYIVSGNRHSLDPDNVWQFTVTPVGSEVPFYVCDQGADFGGVLACRAFLPHSSNTFRLNLNTLRFIASSISFSYADVGQTIEEGSDTTITDDNADSADIHIGRCSPFLRVRAASP